LRRAPLLTDRAARFFEKRRAGAVTIASETSEGLVPLGVWRHEKRLQ